MHHQLHNYPLQAPGCNNEAVRLALPAANHAIDWNLEDDIHDIVPPIMERSRKLQQNRENLGSHE